MKLHGYLSDWVGIVVERKSTLGCCFNMGSIMVLWIGSILHEIFHYLVLLPKDDAFP